LNFRILVVEDDANTRESLQKALNASGNEVLLAQDGVSALAALEARPADLVISDIRMPKMDGMQLLAEIHKRYPSTQVILVTAYGKIETAVDAMKRGALDARAREVTVYRLQVGAYPTLAEAQEKSADVQSATAALSPVLIREKTGTHPFKVWVGAYGIYDEAKEIEKWYEAMSGAAFLVSENIEEESAEGEGLAVPTTLHDQLVEQPRDCDNVAEEELVYNADMSLLLAGQCSSRIDCASYIQVAVPYLLELAGDHPESASSDWAHQNLVSYHT